MKSRRRRKREAETIGEVDNCVIYRLFLQVCVDRGKDYTDHGQPSKSQKQGFCPVCWVESGEDKKEVCCEQFQRRWTIELTIYYHRLG